MPTWTCIVCGVDGRPGCAEAVRLAARLARAESAELVLLHVKKHPSGEAPPASSLARIGQAPDDQTAHWRGLASDLRGEPVRLELASGDPADAIVRFAQRSGCDLIVLGSHAHNRASLALTSVVGRVLAHAQCPVMVVPSGIEDVQPDFPGQAA